MDTTFPFGFPAATTAYFVWYIVTLVIHVVFMNYVLAGSAYLALTTMFTGGPEVSRQRTPTAMVLRDWMPFALSAAITAGVAPLLFVQILYQKAFYTANLLLFHRWMAILPVLIVGFYLLYLLKSRHVAAWRGWVRVVVGLGAFFCFAFTGFSWTENHLLSLDDAAWPGMYASGDMVYRDLRLVPRFLMWAVGAVPTMALVVCWQLRFLKHRGDDVPATEVRKLASLGLGGLAAACGCALWYYGCMDAPSRAAVTGPVARVYFVLAIGGALLQVVSWVAMLRRSEFVTPWLWVGCAGVGMTLLGMAVVREAIRLAAVDIAKLYAHHAEAAKVGGRPVFLFFFLLNALLIAWCFRIVHRGTAARGD